MNDSGVASRLHEVRARIERASQRAQRDPASLRLLAVSKGHSVASILEAYANGQRDFGESYVQELKRKVAELGPQRASGELADLRFHLVGHVQRNKARDAVALAQLIHSVDTQELAHELGKRRSALRELPTALPPLPVLVEVNVGREPQKHGVLPEALAPLLAAVEAEPALVLRGLMTIPPHSEEPSQGLVHFNTLRELRDAHGGATRLPELSMGMSDDLEYAIAAGATLLRVGTAIFGPRPRAG
jgi:pyridoxal phosphate enzyme (YggS family)